MRKLDGAFMMHRLSAFLGLGFVIPTDDEAFFEYNRNGLALLVMYRAAS